MLSPDALEGLEQDSAGVQSLDTLLSVISEIINWDYSSLLARLYVSKRFNLSLTHLF